jgi:hypothetical protein
MSQIVMPIGAFCFGATIGYITYRTLIRSDKARISDLAMVVGTVGGAAVTGLFNPSHGDLFGWYSIGLLAGLIAYFAIFLSLNGKQQTAKVLAGADIAAGQDAVGRPPAAPGMPRKLAPWPDAVAGQFGGG